MSESSTRPIEKVELAGTLCIITAIIESIALEPRVRVLKAQKKDKRGGIKDAEAGMKLS